MRPLAGAMRTADILGGALRGSLLRPLAGAMRTLAGRVSCLQVLVHAQAWQEAEPVLVEVMAQASEIASARTVNLLLRVANRIELAGTGPTSTLADSAQDLRRLLTCA
ncbi:hypothetical protein [Streptosporangium sp. NPDC049046]|uniref:hypothetical protein n=1 Tax=Streptosporangium sp. NPDC049046 TaxID=3155031 RepID=UPI00343A12C9